MNKNITPIILVVLSIGIYFTFTKGKIADLKSIQAVNAQYIEAIQNAERLSKVRDEVNDKYENIPIEDREKLDKMLPSNVDNIRLIIDVNGVAARHGFSLKNVKTTTPEDKSGNIASPGSEVVDGGVNVPSSYNTATLSFSVNANYQNFVAFMKDLEKSLRIIDIAKIEVVTGETDIYEYKVEIKTYWLKQL